MGATMSNGRLTIWIDGREALPVRAIPYVAGWEHLYSPDVVAESLARAAAAPFGKLRNLVAYHRPTLKPLPVMTGEWAAVVAEIKGFEAGLREQRPDTDAMDDHAGYAAWRKGAALKLPAGVFVWLDEFLREREADRKSTPDDRSVTLAPMLDCDMRAAVLEGFEDCPRRGPDADRAMIGYADFAAICQVDDSKNFGGFRVEANGLYVDLPDADATLTPEERAAVTWHPTGQYNKPALPLPCPLGQLRAFLPGAGLLGCLDEEAVDAVLGDDKGAAAYKNIYRCLDGYWERSWRELPHEQRQAWCKALVIHFEESDAGRRWDSYNLMQRQGVADAYDAEHDPAREGARQIGWYDYTMHAAMWLKRTSVKPGEAAMLLWRLDPLERDWRGDAPDPERTYVDGDETTPDCYRVLKRAFEDIAETDPKPRTLLDWRDLAKREGLRYHQWIDEYVRARADELPADSGSGDGAPKVGAGGTAATANLTEIRIAAIVETATRLKYDPLSVATGGKAIIEAECLDKLKGAPHRFTADTFKKAWQAARDAGRIDVENVGIYRGQ